MRKNKTSLQVVVFVDLLGFSESSFKDEMQRSCVLDLLEDLSQMRGEYALENPSGKREKPMQFKPAVSTFSDCIVISYDLDHIKKRHAELVATIPEFLCSYLSFIAKRALPLGLPLRGGISVGQLFHKRGVIFGEALNEAYKIESTVAGYPRIAVSPTAMKLIPDFENCTIKDFDGIIYLNYIHRSIGSYTTSSEMVDWIEKVKVHINSQQISYAEKLSILAKWTWFEKHFEDVIASDYVKALLSKY